MTFDENTGEFFENGHAHEKPISVQATETVVRAKRETEALLQGRNAPSLQFGIFMALQKIPVWIKAAASGHREIKYAPLKDILATVRPVLLEHGIRIRQGADRSWPADDGSMKGRLVPVYTDLIHVPTGEMERTIIEIPLLKMDPQAMGSAITYGKRYSLLAALGLATDEADDDGESAKVRDIHEKSPDSKDLLELKSEMDAIANKEKASDEKKLEELTKWGMDGKSRARLNRLSEAEQERAKAHYAMLRERLQGE